MNNGYFSRIITHLLQHAGTCQDHDQSSHRARESNIAAGPEFAGESWQAQQADALVTMAKSYLSGHCEASSAAADNYHVTVHVDHSALPLSVAERTPPAYLMQAHLA